MIRHKFHKILIFCALMLTISACNSQPKAILPSDQCIAPFDVYAYTVPEEGARLKETILPLTPWQLQTSLPEFPEVPYPYNEFDVETTRFINGHIEIWFETPDTNVYFDSNAEFGNFLIYRTDTKEWKTVSAKIENSRAVVGKLFVAKDSTIWGQSFWDNDANADSLPVLGKYNERTERFEFEQAAQEIPALWEATDQFPFWDRVLLDSDGIFWILVHNDAIYSYNPALQKVNRHADIPDIVVDQAILSPNGSIYFRRFMNSTTFRLQEEELFQFIPETGEVRSLEIPSKRWPSFGNILVDHNGRLWLDTVGWREPDGAWHMIYPNTWLYFWKMEWEEDYRWATPHVILESSNGFIWYRTEKGMAWLNPNSMQGCWFTTENTNIVEDQQHNLWMVTDNKLYKYHLNP